MNRFLMIALGMMTLGCSNVGSTTANLTADELDALLTADSPLLPMDDAIAFAQAEAEGWELVAVELSIEANEAEPPAWDCTFHLDGRLMDVDVNGLSGEIFEVEDEGRARVDPSDFIGIAAAREAAAVEAQGFVLAVEGEVEEREGDHPHYDVVVYTADKQFVEVEIHALTGEVTEVEIESVYED